MFDDIEVEIDGTSPLVKPNPRILFEGDDFPEGDGDPKCLTCKGEGIVLEKIEIGPPIARTCKCRLRLDIIDNLNRGWVNLSKALKVPESPLTPHVRDNLLITSEIGTLRPYLKHAMAKQGPTFSFRVITDVDLLDSWLGNVEAFDSDVAGQRDGANGNPVAISLTDLVNRHKLLIILVGTKKARNEAAPECLAEALSVRDSLGLPTWVVDKPTLRLTHGHISYNMFVEEFIHSWKHIVLTDPGIPQGRTVTPTAHTPREALPPMQKTVIAHLDLDSIFDKPKDSKWKKRK